MSEMASLEQGYKLLRDKDQPEPFSFLDCDGNRHADPVLASNPANLFACF
jgi:hypothetical protein